MWNASVFVNWSQIEGTLSGNNREGKIYERTLERDSGKKYKSNSKKWLSRDSLGNLLYETVETKFMKDSGSIVPALLQCFSHHISTSSIQNLFKSFNLKQLTTHQHFNCYYIILQVSGSPPSLTRHSGVEGLKRRRLLSRLSRLIYFS